MSMYCIVLCQSEITDIANYLDKHTHRHFCYTLKLCTNILYPHVRIPICLSLSEFMHFPACVCVCLFMSEGYVCMLAQPFVRKTHRQMN